MNLVPIVWFTAPLPGACLPYPRSVTRKPAIEDFEQCAETSQAVMFQPNQTAISQEDAKQVLWRCFESAGEQAH
ncbi:hypothetical protein HKW98_18430 [Stutzerimonas urumqiensis]|uniref:hypothetical protein n=1 Tax=Stutzerimonas urumqiensis TaxID=638269 RepID=UPI003BA8E2B5